LPQAEKIDEMVAGFRYPVILGGDFNATPTSSTVAKLKEQLTLGCNGGCPLTMSSSNPYESIDHFFYKSTGFNRLDYYTVQTLASDHLPLIATWTLK
jgi:endonuclease/exonuclease/phosphatase (EEP) superfamily protein YafD